ncbi:MAG: sigma-70 family RNA polymerase sigma factor [Lentisphaeraceae bacterium]|nr:sigma-70 family RNA polymerase sigma factor [Lentisphaeraceae bacterium]
MNKVDFIVEQLDILQGDLFAYILSLTGNYNDSKDVLQEANIVILKKQSSFQSGTSFRAWAFTIARFQVMAFRKKCSRERLVFSEKTFNDIFNPEDDLEKVETENKFDRLDDCIDKLPDKQKQIVRRKYLQGRSLKQISEEISSNENSISQALFRARKNLVECVHKN